MSTDRQPDRALCALAHEGDVEALTELWDRHGAYGLAVAHGQAPEDDWEAISARAWTLILDATAEDLAGGFRPYLYLLIRAITSAGESSPRPDAMLTAAYHDLSPQWREVLWYAHIDQMRPFQMAALIGTGAPDIPAVLHQAREGLRQAWVKLHIEATIKYSLCRKVWEQADGYVRGELTEKDRAAIDRHRRICKGCAPVDSDAISVASHLRTIVLPSIAGTGGAANLLAYLQTHGPCVRAPTGLPPLVEHLIAPGPVPEAVKRIEPPPRPPRTDSRTTTSTDRTSSTDSAKTKSARIGFTARTESRTDSPDRTESRAQTGSTTESAATGAKRTGTRPASPKTAALDRIQAARSRLRTSAPPTFEPAARTSPFVQAAGADAPPLTSGLVRETVFDAAIEREPAPPPTFREWFDMPRVRRRPSRSILIGLAVLVLVVLSIIGFGLVHLRAAPPNNDPTSTVSGSPVVIPDFPPVIELIDTGANNNLLPIVSGSGPANATIQVRVGDASATVTSDQNGAWTTFGVGLEPTETRGAVMATIQPLESAAAAFELNAPPMPTLDQAETLTLIGLSNTLVEVIVDGGVADTVQLGESGTYSGLLDLPSGSHFLQSRYVEDERYGPSSQVIIVTAT